MNLEDQTQETVSLRAQLTEARDLARIRREQNVKLKIFLVGAVLCFAAVAFSATLWLLNSEQSSSKEVENSQEVLVKCDGEKTELTLELKSCTNSLKDEVQRRVTLEAAVSALTVSSRPVERTEDAEEALEKVPISQLAGIDVVRLEELCDRGHGTLEACTEIAMELVENSEGRPDPKKWQQAHKWLKWGCPQALPPKQAFRDPKACEKLGRAYNLGRGIAVDKELAKAHLALACDLGSPVACRDLGYIYYEYVLADGGGDDADLQKARTLLNSACIGSDAVACHYLAFTLVGDPDVGTMNVWRVFRKSCELGLPDACKIIRDTYPKRPLWSPSLKLKNKNPAPE